MQFQKLAIVAASASLGIGAALVAGACGEERGSVEVEGGTTGSTGTTGTTGPTGTTGTTGTTTTPPTPDSTGTSTSP